MGKPPPEIGTEFITYCDNKKCLSFINSCDCSPNIYGALVHQVLSEELGPKPTGTLPSLSLHSSGLT